MSVMNFVIFCDIFQIKHDNNSINGGGFCLNAFILFFFLFNYFFWGWGGEKGMTDLA